MGRRFMGVVGLLLGVGLGACNTAVSPPTPPVTLTPSPWTTPIDIDTPPPLPQHAIVLNATQVAQTATAVSARTPLPTGEPFCPGTPPTRMILQQRGRVLQLDNSGEESLNLRAGPGTNYRILTKINQRELFLVLDGPACAEDYVWYRVRYGEFSGWVAEGDLTQYYIEPYLPA